MRCQRKDQREQSFVPSNATLPIPYLLLHTSGSAGLRKMAKRFPCQQERQHFVNISGHEKHRLLSQQYSPLVTAASLLAQLLYVITSTRICFPCKTVYVRCSP
ncbi:hypothetical protein AMECASPLE_024829 [Ameca splendens]|uniref:Uncharacterized protein n=1 Tax=Ameca splendens TaxID=208324 RepID=A0ABV0XHF4_9TELE